VPGRECAHVGSIQTDREGAGSMRRMSAARRALGQGRSLCFVSNHFLHGPPKKEKEESEKNHADALEQHACDVQQLTRDGYVGGVDARRLNGTADNDALCRLEDC
jgi:hypothetical protein